MASGSPDAHYPISPSLREWRHGDNAPKSPGPDAGPPGLWWRVSYAPVGNKLTVALMNGTGNRAEVMALDSIEMSPTSSANDREVVNLKQLLLGRYEEAQRLLNLHGGPCGAVQ